MNKSRDVINDKKALEAQVLIFTVRLYSLGGKIQICWGSCVYFKLLLLVRPGNEISPFQWPK